MRDDVSKVPRDVLSREAVEAARRMNDANLLAYVLPGRWSAISGPDRAEELRELAAAAIENAERCRERDRLGEALMVSVIAHLLFGDMDHARQAFARYVDIGEELSRPSIQWYGTVISGVLLLSDGRLSQA
jgi:hypothetical protein